MLHSLRSNSRSIQAFLLLAVLGTPGLRAQDDRTQEFSEALALAEKLSLQKKYKAAIPEYERANGLASGRCESCLLALAVLYNLEGDFQNAEGRARQAIAVGEEKSFRQRAHRELGIALYSQAAGKRPKRSKDGRKGRTGGKRTGSEPETILVEAEKAFRKALKLAGDDDPTLYFLLANSLADRMNRSGNWELHDEIKPLARKYLAALPDGPDAEWARRASCLTDLESHAGKGFEPKPRKKGFKALPVGGQVSKPDKLFSPQPPYSKWARAARLQGPVILQGIIDTKGEVRNLEVMQGLPLCLSELALQTVGQWRFSPAMLAGRAVDVYYNVVINFRLE